MRPSGFTLVEALISLAILVVVLSVANGLIVSNQGVTTRQITSNNAEEDARLAMLRLSEILSQAAYIYPLGRDLNLTVGSATATVRTGSSALAALVPYGSPYCRVASPTPAQRQSYCGYVYRVESRSPHQTILGNLKGNSGWVLAEYRVQWLTWDRNTIPTTAWTGQSTSIGIIADSVDSTDTNLGVLSISPRAGTGFDATAFPASVTDTASTSAMIGAARPTLRLSFANGLRSVRTEDIFVRSIPRAAPPGTGVN